MTPLSSYSIKALLCICFLCWHCVHADLSPSNNYTVTASGVTCVVMTTGIQLTIPYSAGTKNLTSTVTVPSNATANGTCNASTNTLNIYFLDTYGVTFVIKRNPDQSYHWQSVTINYQLDNTHFPNASLSTAGPVSQKTTLANTTNTVTSSGSYQCQGQTDIQLTAGVVMTMVDLHYRAFGNDSNTGFNNDNVQHCSPTVTSTVPETDITLTIGVGIALGVLILLVVLIYVVTSRVTNYTKDDF